MNITELLGAMPQPLARAVNVGTRVITLAILGLLVVAGMNIVQRTMDQQMSVLYWPVGLQYLAMPVGSGLAFLYVAYETLVVLRGGAPFGALEE
jgi:TRAP-type C4-dicarboxylate transport system permease small subunit